MDEFDDLSDRYQAVVQVAQALVEELPAAEATQLQEVLATLEAIIRAVAGLTLEARRVARIALPRLTAYYEPPRGVRGGMA